LVKPQRSITDPSARIATMWSSREPAETVTK